MKNSNSYYPAKICIITVKEHRVNIALTAILTENNNENKDIFQSGYTARNRSISIIGLQYIHG